MDQPRRKTLIKAPPGFKPTLGLTKVKVTKQPANIQKELPLGAIVIERQPVGKPPPAIPKESEAATQQTGDKPLSPSKPPIIKKVMKILPKASTDQIVSVAASLASKTTPSPTSEAATQQTGDKPPSPPSKPPIIKKVMKILPKASTDQIVSVAASLASKTTPSPTSEAATQQTGDKTPSPPSKPPIVKKVMKILPKASTDQIVSVAASLNSAAKTGRTPATETATVVPAAPATVEPAAPANVEPAAPATAEPAAPATAEPAAPATVEPAAPATVGPPTPATVEPAAPATVGPPTPKRPKLAAIPEINKQADKPPIIRHLWTPKELLSSTVKPDNTDSSSCSSGDERPDALGIRHVTDIIWRHPVLANYVAELRRELNDLSNENAGLKTEQRILETKLLTQQGRTAHFRFDDKTKESSTKFRHRLDKMESENRLLRQRLTRLYRKNARLQLRLGDGAAKTHMISQTTELGVLTGSDFECGCSRSLAVLCEIFEDLLPIHDEKIWQERLEGLEQQRDKLITQLQEINLVCATDPFVASKLSPFVSSVLDMNAAMSRDEQLLVALRQLAVCQASKTTLEEQLATEKTLGLRWRFELRNLAHLVSQTLNSLKLHSETRPQVGGDLIFPALPSIGGKMTPPNEFVVKANRRILEDARRKFSKVIPQFRETGIRFYVQRIKDLEVQVVNLASAKNVNTAEWELTNMCIRKADTQDDPDIDSLIKNYLNRIQTENLGPQQIMTSADIAEPELQALRTQPVHDLKMPNSLSFTGLDELGSESMPPTPNQPATPPPQPLITTIEQGIKNLSDFGTPQNKAPPGKIQAQIYHDTPALDSGGPNLQFPRSAPPPLRLGTDKPPDIESEQTSPIPIDQAKSKQPPPVMDKQPGPNQPRTPAKEVIKVLVKKPRAKVVPIESKPEARKPEAPKSEAPKPEARKPEPKTTAVKGPKDALAKSKDPLANAERPSVKAAIHKNKKHILEDFSKALDLKNRKLISVMRLFSPEPKDQLDADFRSFCEGCVSLGISESMDNLHIVFTELTNFDRFTTGDLYRVLDGDESREGIWRRVEEVYGDPPSVLMRLSGTRVGSIISTAQWIEACRILGVSKASAEKLWRDLSPESDDVLVESLLGFLKGQMTQDQVIMNERESRTFFKSILRTVLPVQEVVQPDSDNELKKQMDLEETRRRSDHAKKLSQGERTVDLNVEELRHDLLYTILAGNGIARWFSELKGQFDAEITTVGDRNKSVEFMPFFEGATSLLGGSIDIRVARDLFDILCSPISGLLTLENLYRNLENLPDITMSDLSRRLIDRFGNPPMAAWDVLEITQVCTTDDFLDLGSLVGVPPVSARKIWKNNFCSLEPRESLHPAWIMKVLMGQWTEKDIQTKLSQSTGFFGAIGSMLEAPPAVFPMAHVPQLNVLHRHHRSLSSDLDEPGATPEPSASSQLAEQEDEDDEILRKIMTRTDFDTRKSVELTNFSSMGFSMKEASLPEVDIQDVLEQCELFSKTPMKLIEALTESSVVEKYDPGETVFYTGEKIVSAYIVGFGTCGCLVSGTLINTLKMGSIFPLEITIRDVSEDSQMSADCELVALSELQLLKTPLKLVRDVILATEAANPKLNAGFDDGYQSDSSSFSSIQPPLVSLPEKSQSEGPPEPAEDVVPPEPAEDVGPPEPADVVPPEPAEDVRSESSEEEAPISRPTRGRQGTVVGKVALSRKIEDEEDARPIEGSRAARGRQGTVVGKTILKQRSEGDALAISEENELKRLKKIEEDTRQKLADTMASSLMISPRPGVGLMILNKEVNLPEMSPDELSIERALDRVGLDDEFEELVIIAKEDHRNYPNELNILSDKLNNRKGWRNLNPKQNRFVLSLMSRESYKPGEVIQTYGSSQVAMKVIISGKVRETLTEKQQQDGFIDEDLLFRIGEASLKNEIVGDIKVTQTVTSETHVVLWKLRLDTFLQHVNEVFVKRNQKITKIEKALRYFKFFQDLTETERIEIARLLQVEKIEKCIAIQKQDHRPHNFYFVVKGLLCLAAEHEDNVLYHWWKKPGSFVGDFVLQSTPIGNAESTAYTIRSCLVLSAPFKALLGCSTFNQIRNKIGLVAFNDLCTAIGTEESHIVKAGSILHRARSSTESGNSTARKSILRIPSAKSSINLPHRIGFNL